MAANEIPIGGYQCKLLNRVEVAEGTMAFYFEKPPRFDFKPGQSADLTLANPPETDAAGNTRTFSIASPPFENHLMFATRMRDTALKRSLKKVPLGTQVKIDPPVGSFTLHKNSCVSSRQNRNHTFSQHRAASRSRLASTQVAFLLFQPAARRRSVSRCLQMLEKPNPNFQLVCTEMQKSKKEWKGETGLINQEMLSRHLTNLQGPIYYIAGPPAMVAGLRKMLVAASVDEDDIRTEDFAGY